MTFFQKFSILFEHIHQKKLKKYLKKIKINTLIDVGAYRGNFINNFNIKYLKKIYAFEPDKKNTLNIRKKFNKIKIYNFCLAEKKTVKFFLINKDKTTSTLESNIRKNFLFKIKENLLHLDYFKKILVRVETLDNIFKKVDNVSFLKIDAEGGDLNVLKGGEKIIKKINFILIEIKPINFYKNNSPIDIYNFLKINFNIKKIFSTFPYFYCDVLFVNKNYINS